MVRGAHRCRCHQQQRDRSSQRRAASAATPGRSHRTRQHQVRTVRGNTSPSPPSATPRAAGAESAKRAHRSAAFRRPKEAAPRCLLAAAAAPTAAASLGRRLHDLRSHRQRRADSHHAEQRSAGSLRSARRGRRQVATPPLLCARAAASATPSHDAGRALVHTRYPEEARQPARRVLRGCVSHLCPPKASRAPKFLGLGDKSSTDPPLAPGPLRAWRVGVVLGVFQCLSTHWST